MGINKHTCNCEHEWKDTPPYEIAQYILTIIKNKTKEESLQIIKKVEFLIHVQTSIDNVNKKL